MAWPRACLLIVIILAAGCGASRPENGRLEVRLHDHREAIGDFRELWLTLSEVAVHPVGQPRSEGWIELEPEIRELDLTRYTAGQEAVIAQVEMQTGLYDAVRLGIDRASGPLLDGPEVEVKIVLDPVALDFWVRNGRTAIIGLDLVVLDVSDHPDRDYELNIREGVVIRDE